MVNTAKKQQRIFSCDFETYVSEKADEQNYTFVWLSAFSELYTDNEKIYQNIEDLFEYFFSLKENIILYFHNLKFDGEFILPYIMNKLKLCPAFKGDSKEFCENKNMPNNSYKYLISDMGVWYTITLKIHNKIIEIRDSYKLLPFSVDVLGKAFNTKHRKLEIEYKGDKKNITEEEKLYILNDVRVVRECLEIMFADEHNRLTIGSCCLSEFKSKYSKNDYSVLFADLSQIESSIKNINADTYIRRSYKGAWCYVKKEIKGIVINEKGYTLDVNSLYPSVMHSISGNYYPVGKPCFFVGDIPEEAKKIDRYYFVRVKCRFKIKENFLPFIQVKGSIFYRGNECLETSDYTINNKKSRYAIDEQGYRDSKVEMVLTQTDFAMIQEHYYLYDLEIIDGCYFYAVKGLFDDYINKYMEIKQKEKGAKRTIAKLFLNNLYGKMASSDESSYKLAYIKENGIIGYTMEEAHDKQIGYIPIGSAITSYARSFTIRTAQANYESFCYADTDSIHCVGDVSNVKKVEIHSTKLLHWKHETNWDSAIFTRQKTYIEHVVEEDGKTLDSAYYNIKCAGMNDKCKLLLECSLLHENSKVISAPKYKKLLDGRGELNKAYYSFLFDEKGNEIHRTLKDFNVGLCIPAKLIPRRVVGGIVLVDTTFEIK